MPTIKCVEKKIFEVEGVKVKFKQDGRDVRSDRVVQAQYEAQRMLKNAASVNDLISLRLKTQSPGFDFEVLNKEGRRASGQTKLSTIRDTFLDN